MRDILLKIKDILLKILEAVQESRVETKEETPVVEPEGKTTKRGASK